MGINYEVETAAVIAHLELEGYSAKTITEHRRCFDGLRKYLSKTAAPFSMETAVNWLAGRKAGWSYDTYKRYRRAVYRLDKYLESGNIDREVHCGSNRFAYGDAGVNYIKLSDHYKALFRDFYGEFSHKRSKGTLEHALSGCTEFLLFISGKGCESPAEITIDHLLEYLQRLRGLRLTVGTQVKYASGINNLLAYFYDRGYIPRCYSSIIFVQDEKIPTSMKLPENDRGTAFQPSKNLEPKIDEFLSKIEEWRYSVPPREMYIFVFNGFLRFLEVNHIEYAPAVSDLWLKYILRDTSFDLRRQVITRFDDFMRTGSIEKRGNAVWRPLLIDALPAWSRSILDDYLASRRKDGWEHSSINMCRSSCVRFFGFLERKGVTCADGITAALVKEFHDTDPHMTPEGRNAYSVRVRQLLVYMAERNLTPPNLYLAVSTQCAPSRDIVSVMSAEMESAIYDYRRNAKNALQLRNAAIVMIGLRMGLRASDIVNLKIGNFDLKNRKLTIIQSKTSKTISLPIPTDVGNSVCRYIMDGRPPSVGTFGDGYVFIRHRAPFSKLERTSCRKALIDILSAYDLKLPGGQGFHMTRRTFATRLLTSRNKIDTIADSLGHSDRQSVGLYLSLDEAGMRQCPLSFEIGGPQ